MRFNGEIKSGKLEIYNKDKMKEWISVQKDENVVIEIKKPKKIRSVEENNYYWGVVVKMLSDELGYFPDEMHEALKYKFLRKEGRNELTTTKSTAGLSSAEFENYLFNIRVWALIDLRIAIPLPNES